MINTGIPKRAYYSAYNVTTQKFVADDEGNHTIILRLDGVDLGPPDNSIVSTGGGTYEIALSDAERSGLDLVLRGTSSTEDIIIIPIHYPSDERYQEVWEDDGEGNLRGTAKYLEQAVAKFNFNNDDIPVVDVQWWQGQNISGLQMIEDLDGEPRWTVRAMSNAPQPEASLVTFVNMLTKDAAGYLEILRGDTFRFPLLLNVSLATVDEIIFAIKRDCSDADEDSLLYISSVNGLMYINGEVAVTAGNGEILVDSSLLGVILTNCAAEEMAKLPKLIRGAVAEVQLRTGVTIYTPWTQKTSIVGDIVRATS